MKSNLLLLSDIYGLEKQDWLDYYAAELAPYYTVSVYDSGVLAELSPKLTSKEERHQKLVTGGIDKAAQNLLSQAPKNAIIIGYSVGGTIAWKAALKGLESKELWLLSATRLRYEEEKPKLPIHLYYGEKDAYQPHGAWFTKMGLTAQLIRGKGHEYYRATEEADVLIQKLQMQKRF